MLIFFLAAFGIFFWASSTRPKVMVLHSYDQDYIWTTEVNVGLERVFSGQSWIKLKSYYMKTKQSKDQSYLRRAGIAAKRAIDNFHPDILIVIDDPAQKLVAMDYVNDPQMSIIFAGVNGGIEAYGYQGAKNVTGIFERKPIAALVETLQVLHRHNPAHKNSSELIRVKFLADDGHSAHRDADFLAGADWGNIRYMGSTHVASFADWQEAVRQIEGTDYLLVGAYRKLTNKQESEKFIGPKEVIRWTRDNSHVPMIGMNVFCSEDGTMLSVGISPYEQGEYAASTALKIIREQISAGDIPLEIPQQYIVAMRKSILDKRGVQMPKIYEAFSRAANYYYD